MTLSRVLLIWINPEIEEFCASVQVTMTTFLVVVVHTMLPLSRRKALIAGSDGNQGWYCMGVQGVQSLK
jgi:hypothetical protein